MTVITLSTVGYGEVTELSTGGKLFTVLLIVLGIGAASYSVMTAATFLIEGQLREVLDRRNKMREIDKLQDHVVVCGYGRLGQVVALELAQSKIKFVIVESDEALQRQLEKSGYPYVIGSALDDDCLLSAGLMKSRALVLALQSESDNVFITLAVRELHPDLPIHARAETETGIRRLGLAGAAQVVSPFQVGGLRIANKIVRPAVVDFIELSGSRSGENIVLEQVQLMEGCKLHGIRLSDLPKHGVKVLVVAIKSSAGETRINPGREDQILAGDHIVVVGDSGNLEQLALLSMSP